MHQEHLIKINSQYRSNLISRQAT